MIASDHQQVVEKPSRLRAGRDSLRRRRQAVRVRCGAEGGRGPVQLRGSRGQGAGGAPAAADPGDRQRGAGGLSREFAALYSQLGRPSIPPERLLRALLLQAFYSIRSERLLMEQLDYNLLFRWFVGLGIDDPVWHRPRSRTTATGCSRATSRPSSWRRCWTTRRSRLLSSEHFTVDGTLVEAWARMKSFRPKDDRDEPPTRRPQREPRLPRRAARQRQPRLDHRSGCAAVPQRSWQGGAALLHGPRADGEPPWPGGRGRADPRRRLRRAARGGGLGRRRAAPA